MKQKNLLIAGILGLGAYALFKGSASANEWQDVVNGAGMPINEKALNQLNQNVQQAKDEGTISEGTANEILSSFNTVYDSSQPNKTRVTAGVDLINKAFENNVQLPRTSSVIKSNVTATLKDTGEVVTGNIVKLGTGSVKLISVKPVSSSSGGSSSSSSSSGGSSSRSRVLKSNNAKISRDSDGRLRIKL